ncbi:uncharacterized protein [Procambarus clarkii]|uniref:uncharacterized protein isoform X2 n=1 Tax=Procambarus clarkii TaxID=6728 RepID=UPI003741F5B6
MSLACIKTIGDDITDSHAFGVGDVIIYDLPAAVVRHYGLASVIWKKFSYARVEREGLGNANRAIIRCRSTPGDIVVKIAPLPSDGQDLIEEPVLFFRPTFVGLISAFGAGAPFESNPIAQEQVQTSADTHYVTNVTLDTAKNRRYWLKMSLTKVGNLMAATPTMTRLVVPYGLGASRDGMVNWNKDIGPMLLSLHQELAKLNKELVILKRPAAVTQSVVPLPFDDPSADNLTITLDTVVGEGGTTPRTSSRSTPPAPPATPRKKKHSQEYGSTSTPPPPPTASTSVKRRIEPLLDFETGANRRIDSILDVESQEIFLLSSPRKNNESCNHHSSKEVEVAPATVAPAEAAVEVAAASSSSSSEGGGVVNHYS